MVHPTDEQTQAVEKFQTARLLKIAASDYGGRARRTKEVAADLEKSPEQIDWLKTGTALRQLKEFDRMTLTARPAGPAGACESVGSI